MSGLSEVSATCGCQKMRRNYHPANKTLLVRPATTKQPRNDTPMRTQSQNHRRWQVLRNPDFQGVQKYKKLISCCKLLPDPVGDVIYYRHKDKDMGSTAYLSCVGTNNAVTLVPMPIQLPDCCCRHRREVHQVVLQHKKLLYNSPEPPALPNMHRLKDRLERLVGQGLDQNSLRQYPLGSVRVRWHTPSPYTAVQLWSLMSRYGSVNRVHFLSACSAVVVYDKMGDACKPVQLKFVDHRPGSRIFCDWLHGTMKAKTFVCSNDALRPLHNVYLYPKE